MASNNGSNKTVLYTYLTPAGDIVTVYNDGTEAFSNATNANTVQLGNKTQNYVDSISTNHIVYADNAGDKIDGRGVSGNNSYIGGNGKDELWATKGDSYLDGANGTDILHGSTVAGAHTTMVGGNGGDVLYGGAGFDTFLYRGVADSPYVAGVPASTASPNAWDIIQNFTAVFLLNSSLFSSGNVIPLPTRSTFQLRYERLSEVILSFVQAAVFDRLKMVLKRIVRASLRRFAASLSLRARACASSCRKVIPGLRNC